MMKKNTRVNWLWVQGFTYKAAINFNQNPRFWQKSWCGHWQIHTSTLTGQTWPIKHSITCEDSNVVYSVTCSHKAGQCLRTPAQYVGKVGSTKPCRVRCTEHRGAVTHHFDTGVGEHFNLPGHDLADFNFLPFEKVRSRDPFEIEARESFWIEKYGVLGEGGMNRRSWGEFYNNILIILQQLKCKTMPYLGLFLKMFV